MNQPFWHQLPHKAFTKGAEGLLGIEAVITEVESAQGVFGPAVDMLEHRQTLAAVVSCKQYSRQQPLAENNRSHSRASLPQTPPIPPPQLGAVGR